MPVGHSYIYWDISLVALHHSIEIVSLVSLFIPSLSCFSCDFRVFNKLDTDRDGLIGIEMVRCDVQTHSCESWSNCFREIFCDHANVVSNVFGNDNCRQHPDKWILVYYWDTNNIKWPLKMQCSNYSESQILASDSYHSDATPTKTQHNNTPECLDWSYTVPLLLGQIRALPLLLHLIIYVYFPQLSARQFLHTKWSKDFGRMLYAIFDEDQSETVNFEEFLVASYLSCRWIRTHAYARCFLPSLYFPCSTL